MLCRRWVSLAQLDTRYLSRAPLESRHRAGVRTRIVDCARRSTTVRRQERWVKWSAEPSGRLDPIARHLLEHSRQLGLVVRNLQQLNDLADAARVVSAETRRCDLLQIGRD